MTKNQFNIKQKISKTELSEIKNWLHIELKESPNDKGFYHNWNIIEQAYLDNEMFIIKNETSVIGFLVWTKGNLCRNRYFRNYTKLPKTRNWRVFLQRSL